MHGVPNLEGEVIYVIDHPYEGYLCSDPVLQAGIHLYDPWIAVSVGIWEAETDTYSVVPAVDIYGLRRAGMVIAELAKSVSVTSG